MERQLETLEEEKGTSSTHGKGFNNDDVNAREDWQTS